jgi:hypothetical protein
VAVVGNVNEMLEVHVVLDLECLDRVYLNAYVPKLQVSGRVVTFFSQHRNQPIASPALIQKMGEVFRLAVANFAKRHQIPIIRFATRDRQIDLIQPFFQGRLAALRGGHRRRSGVRKFRPVPSAECEFNELRLSIGGLTVEKKT